MEGLADDGAVRVEVLWGAVELGELRRRAERARDRSGGAPENEEVASLLDYAHDFLHPFAIAPDTMVSNADGVHVGAALVGGMVLPLSKPRRGRALTRTSYTASAFSHYVHYPADEICVLLRKLQTKTRSWVLRKVAHCLAGSVLWSLAFTHWAISRLFAIDSCVYINNWLLSTCLLPRLPAGEALRAGLGALTEQLAASEPNAALAFRSVDAMGAPGLAAALESLGYLAIPARYVHYHQLHVKPTKRRLENLYKDLKFAEKVLRDHGKGGALEWRRLEPGDLEEFPLLAGRVEKLYDLLYVGKYTSINPIFTAKFIHNVVCKQLLTLLVLVDTASGLPWYESVCGALGYYVRNGMLTPPIFGYDTEVPVELGLYRLVYLKALQEADRLGVIYHASGGAAQFKQLRGAKSVAECMYVYLGHLPYWRRVPWLCLHYFWWHLFARIFKFPGGPSGPVAALVSG